MTIAFNGKNLVSKAVQKITVVGHSDNSTSEAIQIILQHGQGRNIQIIGGLIQEQHIRSRHQHSQQI